MDTLRIPAPRRLGWGLVGLTTLLVAITVLSDPAGRLLTAPAAVAAFAVGLRELRAGPVLVADAGGLRVRTGWRQLSASWSSVERLRVTRDRRAELLELDLGRTVLLLSRTRLGRAPEDVLTDLLAIRPPRRGGGSQLG